MQVLKDRQVGMYIRNCMETFTSEQVWRQLATASSVKQRWCVFSFIPADEKRAVVFVGYVDNRHS